MKLKPFRLERYFAEHEFTVPYLLCCSDCESLSVGDLLKLEKTAEEEFASLWLGYTDPLGSGKLRTQIASLYQGISSSQILVHAGAEEAIFNFMNVVLETGDHMIVHAPYYQSLGEVAHSIGAHVTEWKGNPKQSWELDLQFLKENVTDRTKVVVVNFPHNPTGFLPDLEFVQEISDLSNALGFFVFSDEVYRGLEYDPSRRLPSFAELNRRAVSLGVMSKTFGLAGLRIGWVATRNQELYGALASFKDYTTICSSAPSEFLATLALRNRHSIVDRNLDIIGKNLRLIRSLFDRYQDLFVWDEPKAGPIAFPHYLGESVERFCEDSLQHARVLLLPETVYGDEYSCFRIGFGRRSAAEAVHELDRFLASSR